MEHLASHGRIRFFKVATEMARRICLPQPLGIGQICGRRSMFQPFKPKVPGLQTLHVNHGQATLCRLTASKQHLHSEGGLHGTEHTRHRSEDPHFVARLNGTRWRRFGMEVPVGGSLFGFKQRDTPLKPVHRGMNPRQTEDCTCVVDEVPSRNKVRAIDDEVMPFEQRQCILRSEPLRVGLDVKARVQFQDSLT